MKRWSLAILLAPVLGGCVGGSAASAQLPRASGPARGAGDVRGRMERPAQRGRPCPHRPIRPQGGFEVFIAFFVTAGGPVGTHPVPCAVEVWFSRGYHARPALLSFTEVHLRRGVFGRAAINARRAMRFHPEGREYVEGSDGRLRPA
jgi:hypothetical protein